MYINNLGMGHEVNTNSTINSNSNVNSNSEAAKTSAANTAKTSTFPSTLTNALKSQGLTLDADTSLSISEALERLKSDPEWEDVGTALSALYKNQQAMQVQMSLMSAGYTSGLTGLSSAYSTYGGLGALAAGAYGSSNNLLSSSIFGSFLS